MARPLREVRGEWYEWMASWSSLLLELLELRFEKSGEVVRDQFVLLCGPILLLVFVVIVC